MDVNKTLNSLTLEEKVKFLSGVGFWHTEELKEKDIPAIMVSDGPNGLRKQSDAEDNLGVNDSIEAICFPTASCMAASFDTELMENIGSLLGDECLAENVQVLLGPGINMKRSPICGRNFEYYSEDPYLAGKIATGFINGVQSKNVGVSLKHFAANNQEARRFLIDARIDERAFREIYLKAFEIAVKEASPWTLMCSYNRVNGEYSCENKKLLTDILRDEWGFEGLVMTDWGAMNDRIKAVLAGLDLEMPSSHGRRDEVVLNAVKEGKLSEEAVDKCVTRILNLINKGIEGQKQYIENGGEGFYNKDEHHEKSAYVATQSAVLLKNDNKTLPLSTEEKILFVGEFAFVAKYQGGGSSHINCHKIESVTDMLDEEMYSDISNNTILCKGYNIEENAESDAALLKEAISLASDVDKIVVFAGLSDAIEGEGFDRKSINLPDNQNALISEMAKLGKPVSVVLFNGSPVAMPWVNDVDSILEMYLAGEAVGRATLDLLYGKLSPSGHLAETFPLRIEDSPSYLNFPGSRTYVNYSEGIFIGYRYYDYKKLPVLFPFGHGLTYTTFEYSDLKLIPAPTCKCGCKMQVSFKLKNTGDVDAAEVPQLYVKNCPADEPRPIRELRGFKKVFLKAGEEKEVTIDIDKKAFAYYSEEIGDWFVPGGTYTIEIGSSSRDIKLSADTEVKEKPIPYTVTGLSTVNVIKKYCKDITPLIDFLKYSGFNEDNEEIGNDGLGDSADQMAEAMFGDTPIHSIISFSKDTLTLEDVQNCIDELNRLNS